MPSIFGDCSSGLSWSSCSGQVRSDFLAAPKKCAAEWRAYLLTPDAVVTEQVVDRTLCAGYEGRPGSFKLHGKDLGEVTLKWYEGPGKEMGRALVQVRGCEMPTARERSFLHEHVAPHLAECIQLRREVLTGIATNCFQRHVDYELTQVTQRVKKLKEFANTAICAFMES